MDNGFEVLMCIFAVIICCGLCVLNACWITTFIEDSMDRNVISVIFGFMSFGISFLFYTWCINFGGEKYTDYL